jgi:proline iminopeptidase
VRSNGQGQGEGQGEGQGQGTTGVETRESGQGRRWHAHRLPRGEVELAWYEIGDGPPVVLLHGGPGLDHRYVRPLGELLAVRFRCVLYDQRGEGQSRLVRADEHTLHPQRAIEDLEALREHLGLHRLRLVGHSGGANLALRYAALLPERVARLALLGLGPLDAEMKGVYEANVRRPLSAAEREAFEVLSRRRREALAAGDAPAYRAASARRDALHARCWFYSPTVAARYTQGLLELADDPYATAVRAGGAAGGAAAEGGAGMPDAWSMAERITAPALIVYGYQDYEPIVQAYRLKERMPQAQLSLLNECSHFLWLEQPARLGSVLSTFLAS